MTEHNEKTTASSIRSWVAPCGLSICLSRLLNVEYARSANWIDKTLYKAPF